MMLLNHEHEHVLHLAFCPLQKYSAAVPNKYQTKCQIYEFFESRCRHTFSTESGELNVTKPNPLIINCSIRYLQNEKVVSLFNLWPPDHLSLMTKAVDTSPTLSLNNAFNSSSLMCCGNPPTNTFLLCSGSRSGVDPSETCRKRH